jgi:hypothetical protein
MRYQIVDDVKDNWRKGKIKIAGGGETQGKSGKMKEGKTLDSCLGTEK